MGVRGQQRAARGIIPGVVTETARPRRDRRLPIELARILILQEAARIRDLLLPRTGKTSANIQGLASIHIQARQLNSQGVQGKSARTNPEAQPKRGHVEDRMTQNDATKSARSPREYLQHDVPNRPSTAAGRSELNAEHNALLDINMRPRCKPSKFLRRTDQLQPLNRVPRIRHGQRLALEAISTETNYLQGLLLPNTSTTGSGVKENGHNQGTPDVNPTLSGIARRTTGDTSEFVLAQRRKVGNLGERSTLVASHGKSDNVAQTPSVGPQSGTLADCSHFAIRRPSCRQAASRASATTAAGALLTASATSAAGALFTGLFLLVLVQILLIMRIFAIGTGTLPVLGHLKAHTLLGRPGSGSTLGAAALGVTLTLGFAGVVLATAFSARPIPTGSGSLVRERRLSRRTPAGIILGRLLVMKLTMVRRDNSRTSTNGAARALLGMVRLCLANIVPLLGSLTGTKRRAVTGLRAMLATGQRPHAASLASALGRTLFGGVHGLRTLKGLEVLRLPRNLVQHDLTLLPRGSMPRKVTHLKGGPTPHDFRPQPATDLAHVSKEQVVSVHFEAISILEFEKEPLEPHMEIHMGQPPLLQGVKL